MQVDTVAGLSLSEGMFLMLLFGVPTILFFLVVIQHILGVILAKKLDVHFFKPPYFTDGEVVVYGSWPMSLLRYATYIIHTAFPVILHKSRFKGHDSPYRLGKILKLSCQLWVITLISSIVLVPVIILLIIYT